MDEAWISTIISVDDHVVEPPHEYRDLGPKVVRRGVAGITSIGPGVYKEEFDDDSRHKADTWVYDETDYPHSDSTWPETRAVAAKLFDGLSDHEIHRIVRGNAIDLFDLQQFAS